jgi:membrane glycosyltransferase
MLGRRVLVLGGALALSALAVFEMFRVLAFAGLTVLEGALLLPFALLVPWLAVSFVSALAGTWAHAARRRGQLELGLAEPLGPLEPLTELTALLVPVHNESLTRVGANIDAIAASLESTGELAHFHVIVLSDSTDADTWVAEEAAILSLRDRFGAAPKVFYRHRPDNVDLKAGNVGDWVRRFGAPYAHFVVLDADSLMEGPTLVRLAAAMEHHPHVGIIQTIPVVVGAVTLFGRLQQFAGRVYGPVLTGGLAWWHGADGNYWGHNAIVRTRAFAECAGLPHLTGRRPFGGHVMSHDFVEAALVRRAGWAVHLAPTLSGSYEEGPLSLVDLAKRDRRWCQGNLQHIALLRARGLRPMSRLHLLTGIFAYLASPIWLAFLLLGLLASLHARFPPPDGGVAALRDLPAQDAARATRLFVVTMAVLIAPKLLAYGVLVTDRAVRRGCGGARRALGSVIVEIILSALIAPILMLVQTRAVTAVIAGRDAGWHAQRRDGGVAPREILRRHLWHTAFGIALGAASWLVSPSLFVWMSPVVLGLTLAIPISALTARRSAGQAARRIGLFVTPEETAPPPVLGAAEAAARAVPTRAAEAMADLAADARLLAVHRADLPPDGAVGEPIDRDLAVARLRLEEAADLGAMLDVLTPRQKVVALSDPVALTRAVELARVVQPEAATPRQVNL